MEPLSRCGRILWAGERNEDLCGTGSLRRRATGKQLVCHGLSAVVMHVSSAVVRKMQFFSTKNRYGCAATDSPDR